MRDTRSKQKGMQTIGDLLGSIDLLKNKFISREFQDYGYRLAEQLGDLKNKSLYIKLAKTVPRATLEEARNFVKDASCVRSPARLFMWKLKELRPAGVKGGTKKARKNQVPKG